MNDILLIIPAFNEEENIERVVDKLIRDHNDIDYVIINDGSTDSTSDICHERGYNIIDHPHNLGLAGAFHTGMQYAYDHGYSYCVQFDGDGQHRAEFVYPMREMMDKGSYDIVIASRFINAKKPFTLRMLGSNLIERAIKKQTGVDIKDPTSGMRMYNKRMIKEFALNLNYPPEPSTIAYLIKNDNAKVAEIPAVMDERIGGVSYLGPVKAAKYMAKVLGDINGRITG